MRPGKITTMKDLSSGQTFLTKYLVTAVWIIGPIVTAIIVYKKFGQVEGFYMIPIFILPALMTYLPMRISFDDSRIIISDLFKKTEYRFSDIRALQYSRPTISYHPFSQLDITTQDGQIRKVKFSPRATDIFKTFLNKGIQGRHKELMEAWEAHNRQSSRRPHQ